MLHPFQDGSLLETQNMRVRHAQYICGSGGGRSSGSHGGRSGSSGGRTSPQKVGKKSQKRDSPREGTSDEPLRCHNCEGLGHFGKFIFTSVSETSLKYPLPPKADPSQGGDREGEHKQRAVYGQESSGGIAETNDICKFTILLPAAIIM